MGRTIRVLGICIYCLVIIAVPSSTTDPPLAANVPSGQHHIRAGCRDAKTTSKPPGGCSLRAASAGAVPGRGACALVPSDASRLLSLRGGACYSSVSVPDEDDDQSFDPPSRSDWTRRILVTGGCGFMGSYLVDRLVSRYEDYLIVVLDVLDECGSLEHLRESLDQPNCVFVHGDVSHPAPPPPHPFVCFAQLFLYRCMLAM